MRRVSSDSPHRAGPPVGAARFLVVFGLVALAAAAAGDRPRRLEIEMGATGRLVWSRDSTPVLRTLPQRGDGWYSLARRLCGSPAVAGELRRINGGRGPFRDVRVSIPVEVLRGDLRLEAVRHLFPADSRVRDGWRHLVLDPFGGGEESWAWLARTFTGDAGKAGLLRRVNPELAGGAPRRGAMLLIPEAHLVPAFRNVPVRRRPTPTPTPVPTSTPTPRPMAPTSTPVVVVPTPVRPTPVAGARSVLAGAGVLEYGRDGRGEYAVYRLRRGEALYSAVVVRFTGQLHAAEVNATAAKIARRSGIEDVTSIPVGFPVKIPLDLLLPEFLPRGHPRRVAWEKERQELSRFVEKVHAADLSGVHVILDSGHGNRDSGATVAGVWESTYAYDILCRIKRNLERHTKATVWTTIKDRSRGYTVVDRDRLKQDRDQYLLTHPPFRLNDSKTGVHLRWYLANDIVLGREKKGIPRSRVVFVSIHADSLHPSVRGAMVYVPDRHLRPGSFTVNRRSLSKYEEYRRHPRVKMSKGFRARAEASSRRLAGKIVAALRSEGLEVHPYEPVRGSILRGRRRWVPAVLRYNLAQNAVLLEVCNLANTEDRNLLLEARWREQFSRAVVQGLADTFANGGRP